MFISKRKREPAHYMLKIESFSLLSEVPTMKIESDVFEASGHNWMLNLNPSGNAKDEDDDKYISLYIIICSTESLPKGWEVCVDVNFSVYDHISHTYVTFQDVNGYRTRFNEKKKEWGFEKLISVNSFMESGNGYLLNDSCVFGAEVLVIPEYATKDRCLTMIKPPATLNSHTWTIDNFSVVTDKILYSEVFKVGKVKWKLSLYPKGRSIGEGTHLSFYLRMHDVCSLPDGWRVLAYFKLLVKSQNGEDDIEGEIVHWFNHSSVSRGFSRFFQLSELTNAANGFLLNDTLIVAAEISCVGVIKNFI